MAYDTQTQLSSYNVMAQSINVNRKVLTPKTGEKITLTGLYGPAEIQIFDLNGRLLKKYSGISWDGSDTSGKTVSTGIYIIIAEETNRKEKIIVYVK